jgi:hypothetical protein
MPLEDGVSISPQPMPCRTELAMTLLTPHPRFEISLVADDVFAVLSNTDTLGFVHRIDHIYVALSGRDLAHAVEVGQTMSWERALELILTP